MNRTPANAAVYRYAWGPRFRVAGLPVLDRKGQLCRVIVRGAMNSALVEFEDSERAAVSRNALRKVEANGTEGKCGRAAGDRRHRA